MAKYINQSEEVRISIELYRDGEAFGAWLSDNCGGSGIDVKGKSPQDAAEKLAPYIADYFYKH